MDYNASKITDEEFQLDNEENILDISTNIGENISENELIDIDISEPLKPIHEDGKGWLRFMPDFIKEINSKGVHIQISTSANNDMVLEIDGFYKYGPIILEIMPNDNIFAIDKKNQRTQIKTFKDLVQLNYEYWRKSGNKTNGYITPNRPWIDEFIQMKLVKRQVIYIPKDDF